MSFAEVVFGGIRASIPIAEPPVRVSHSLHKSFRHVICVGGKGYSALMWIYIENRSHLLIHLVGCLSMQSRRGQFTLFQLVLKPDGCPAIQSDSHKASDAVHLQGGIALLGSMIRRSLWTHLGLAWAASQTGLTPNVYMFASAGTPNLGSGLATGLEMALGEALVCSRRLDRSNNRLEGLMNNRSRTRLD
ncbi:unnamed protein product, partial [Rhizoctonia solani]